MNKRKKILTVTLFLLLSLISQTVLAQSASSAYINRVPYYSQEQGYWCGPAVLQMVLGFWGISVSQSSIASRVYNQTDKTSNINAMKSYTQSLGFNNTEIIGSIEKLKDYILKGFPAIVLQKISVNNTYGHYRVVVGYDDEKEIFITYDPQVSKNYNITYNQFVDLWNSGSTFTTKNWTLVIEPSSSYSTPSLSPSPSVPEFPSWIILPTFMIVTLLIAVVYFKKRKR
jgi:ABC-type bacteriocin/lantibiotic exporter with double-glycine peptidase domain